MNAMRLAAVGVAVCLLTIGARAEDKADYAKLIVGKWEATKTDEGTLPKGAIVEFTKDGKIKITVKEGDKEMTLEGTYKLSGNKFDLVLKMGDMEHTETITIKKITETEANTVDKDGKTVDLTRKK
jgi:uncharacterized protein (TIGR03066 family)